MSKPNLQAEHGELDCGFHTDGLGKCTCSRPQADHEAEQEQLIEKRIKIASTETTSDDPVVQIAWLADGKDVWNRTNGKRGHSPADARRYIISSVTRLIAAECQAANTKLLERLRKIFETTVVHPDDLAAVMDTIIWEQSLLKSQKEVSDDQD